MFHSNKGGVVLDDIYEKLMLIDEPSAALYPKLFWLRTTR
jgi:hypothetical protein